jgi:tetratricopeptide (TPR) repeat protein
MISRYRLLLITAWLAGLGSTARLAEAQHPIDVQRATASGDYMAALVTYERMPKRVTTTSARIAAAKSAWALSLPSRALEEYDGAIRQGGLAPTDLARAYLGKGIIERQEERYQLAILQAQKALELLTTPSPLRAQVLALWGESLAAMKQFAPAEARYNQALNEADPDSKAELYFLLAQTKFNLGKYQEAREGLQKIPLRHDRAAEALRLLGESYVVEAKYEAAAQWLERGRREYPDAFLDSWTDYILLRAALGRGDEIAANEIKAQAEKRYPPSDPWLSLLTAAAEEFAWRGRAQ